MYSVYWIKLEEHTEIMDQGYVGITKDLKERLRAHRKNRKTSHFTNAIKKYGWSKLVVVELEKDLTLDQALLLEAKYRPSQNMGWNSQRGGELGVESDWYLDNDNKEKHSKATSEATKIGISIKDTPEKRAERARKNWEVNKDSYKDISKGSKNPRSILNEDNVREIKHSLIPSGKSNGEIAAMFNVKPYLISFIRTGKNWSHI